MRTRPWHYIFVPLLLHSMDVYAWGLATHVYFSQLLLWAVPLLDPRLRAAAQRFPHLVLAGSCLPDLALVGRGAKTQVFNDTHQWDSATRLLTRAACDADRAIALGFASHLFVDIIAHNYFVPAHERMWVKLPMITHALAEWTMDAHIASHLFAMPARLLRKNQGALVRYLIRAFNCEPKAARRALRYLGRASSVLYRSRAHQLLYIGAATLDARLRQRYDYYVHETTLRLPEINRLLMGEAPTWRADIACPQRTGHLAHLTRAEVRGPLALPASLFA